MQIYVLYENVKGYFQAPYNFGGTSSLDESKIYEALSPMYELLNSDDTEEGFLKWIVIPMVVVFGEGILTAKGKEAISKSEGKIKIMRDAYAAEKSAYLKGQEKLELDDNWEFVKFANRDIAAVGKAFLNAMKYKKIKLG